MRILSFFFAFITLGVSLSETRESLAQDESGKSHRIVTLSPHLAEIVYASGAGGYVVGVMAGTNYPVEATKHPIVGGFNGIDFEALINLEPTIVLAWKEGNRGPDIVKLKSLGIPVHIFSASNLSDIEHQIAVVSRLFGTEKIADELIISIKNRISSFDHKRDLDHERKVFIKIWDKPIFTIGHDHYINEALKLCGVTNVGEKYPFTAGSISIETMLLSEADLILNLTGLELTDDLEASSKGWFHRSIALRSIESDPDLLMRLSPRFLDGLEILCTKIVAF